MFFQQFVGINALIYYSPTLFETMGLDYDMQLIMSGILNVTQLVGVFSSVWTMDTIGRRPLLLMGSIFMTISHIIIAVLVGLFDKDWPSHRAQGWTSVAFLFFYMLSFGASWGPVPWAMPSEIFPSSLRAKGVALSTCSNWLNNFIIVSFLPVCGARQSTDKIIGSHHSASGPEYWLWSLRLLRRLLSPLFCLDILLCP